MSNPVNVALPAGQWTKVATRVQGARLYIKNNYSRKFYMTYRMTGDDAPVDLTDTIIFDKSGFEEINTANAVDIYIFCSSVFNLISGSVRVSIGQDRDVSIQDQHTKALDLYFLNSAQAPTMLSSDASPNDRTITIDDTTGFIAGTYVGLFSGGGDFYFGTQLGAPAGNVITLDTPIDLQFLTGSNVIAATKNLAVDGSVTPVTFQIGSTGTGQEIDITRLAGYMQSATAMDDAKFAGGDPLVNGIVFRRTDGVITNSWTVHTNAEMSLMCAGDFNYTTKAPAGFFGARLRNSYAGPEKHGVALRLAAGDTLEIIVQDNLLLRMVLFYMMAQGHEVEL